MTTHVRSSIYSNVNTNDVIRGPCVKSVLKRSGKAKIDIALVHSCDLLHCVTDRWLYDNITYL